MDPKESAREVASKGAIEVLVGLSLVAAGLWAGSQLHILWNIWPNVDGVVSSSSVEAVVEVASAKAGGLVRRYKPKVEFHYSVGGKEYITQAASEYTADTYEQAARNLVRMYAPGTHHPLRYNPSDPSDIRFGTLTIGTLVFAFVLLIGGVALSVMGANSFVSAYAQRLRRAPVAGQEIPAPVLPFEVRSRVEPAALMLHCPACGRTVEAGEDTCPNCLKPLRAA